MSKVNLTHGANTATVEAGTSDIYMNASGKLCKKSNDGQEVDLEQSQSQPGESSDSLYDFTGELSIADPVVFTEDGKVRKMVNSPSISTHTLSGITGTPYVTGNSLNGTQGILMAVNKGTNDSFIKLAVVTSSDKLTTSIGTLYTMDGIATNLLRDPIFIRLSNTKFCILATNSTMDFTCFVCNVTDVEGVPTISEEKSFGIDSNISYIDAKSICDNGGSTVDDIYFAALYSGEPVDSIQVYKINITSGACTVYDPEELSCKVSTEDSISFKCVASGTSGMFYAAFNKATDNTIIIADVTVNSSPVSVTITEHAQTESKNISDFIKINTSFIIISIFDVEGSNYYCSNCSNYNTSTHDLDQAQSNQSLKYENLLLEKRFDSISTRTTILYDANSKLYSVGISPLWFMEGQFSMFNMNDDVTSIFEYKTAISLICLTDKTIVVDYDNGNLITKVFNINSEYIVDGIDEGYVFAGFVQTEPVEGEKVKIGGLESFSSVHEDLSPGLLYYLKMDGSLVCFMPSFSFLVAIHDDFSPANITSRSVNVFNAVSPDKIIHVDTRSFLNSRFMSTFYSAYIDFSTMGGN